MASAERSEGIARRIRHFRTTANMSVAGLAMRAGYTDKYLYAIEGGKHKLLRRDTIDRLAEALGVPNTALTGQPYLPTTTTDLETFQVIPRVRAALLEPEDGPVTARPTDQLEVMVDQAMAARMNCDVPALGRYLPDALAETRALWFDHGDPRGAELFVKAAVTASLAIKAAGWIDLAIRTAELADTVADAHGDPVCKAAARFAVAQCALSTGRRRSSASIAAAGVDELDRLTRNRMPPAKRNSVLSWMGMLNLHTALAESGQDTGDPQGRLAAARTLAGQVTGDPWRMEFGEPNVDVWAVAVALEDGSPDLAPALARRVNVNGLHTNQRRSRLWLDTARAAYATDDHEATVRYLLDADRAAPGDIRQRPTAVEMVGHLMRDGSARSPQLLDLAVRVGISVD